MEWVLTEIGLSKQEARVYLYIAKNGSQKAIEISRNLGIHKVEVYRFLKNLENKGLAESTLERPVYFTAIPFEEILDSLISARKRTTSVLVEKRSSILKQWKSMSERELPARSERFLVLPNTESAHSRMLSLLRNTENKICGTTTDFRLLHAEQYGFLTQSTREIAERCKHAPISLRLLSQITKENLKIAKNYLEKLEHRGIRVEIRHLSPETKFVPRLAIRDDEEAVFFLTPKRLSVAEDEDRAMWTNSKMVVSALQVVFDKLWNDSKPIIERIDELQNQP